MYQPHADAVGEFIVRKEDVNSFGILFKPVMWFMAFLLAAVVAGCGSGGGNDQIGADPGPAPNPAGAVCAAGPACVPLATAGRFAILSVSALTNVTPSVVTGDVGLTVAAGALIGLTCAEVSGQIFSKDVTGPPCKVADAAMLTQAEIDADHAYNDAIGRKPAAFTELGAGNIGGLILDPGIYEWSTGVTIPTNVTLTGGPNDVWIFQIEQTLSVSPGVRIILAGGALPQNVYWAPAHDVDLGENSQFTGLLLPAAAVFMRKGASINGRLLAFAVHLDQNTVTRPGP